MARHFTWFVFFLLTCFAQAQNDSTTTPATRIAFVRQQLLNTFSADDPAAAALWRDSLTRLEDSNQVALVWDERWMLYYWEEAYGNLFDEVARFDAAERQRIARANAPPQDSLFEVLDRALYERRFQIYENIGRGFLSEEEKQFAFIMLDYLLRLNQKEQTSGEWSKRLESFMKRYPDSRFGLYIKGNLYAPEQPVYRPKVKTDRGLTIDVLFVSGRWRNDLERTLRPPYGFDIGLAFWVRRWNFSVRCLFGWQKLSRSVYQSGYEWPKDDPSSLIVPSLELGYKVINGPKLQVSPVVLGGLSILKPPAADEEEDNPPPDYYSNFHFTKGSWGAAINADIKLKTFDTASEDLSFIGLRLRLGYNLLYWGNTNPALQGNMFYFSVGINLSGYAFISP